MLEHIKREFWNEATVKNKTLRPWTPSTLSDIKSLCQRLLSSDISYNKAVFGLVRRAAARRVIVSCEQLCNNCGTIMSKPENKTGSEKVTVSLSDQATDLLDQLAKMGLLGKNRAEVAGHLINDALMKSLRDPFFNLKLKVSE